MVSSKLKFGDLWLYTMLASPASVTRRALISYIAVKCFSSAGQTVFSYQALLWKETKNFCLIHFRNTYTQIRDYLILFIKTGDAHKIQMLSHTIVNIFKKCNWGDGNIVKSYGGSKMVFVFTITEINYLLVSLFFDLVLAISYLYLCY